MNFYQILGVEVNATAAQIRAAYRQRALQLHPDVNPAPDAAERFARLQREYDLMLVAAVSGSAPRPTPPPAHYTWSNIADPRSRVARPLDDHDFEDLYAAFFAPRARRGSGSL